jgi:predicted metalloprotease
MVIGLVAVFIIAAPLISSFLSALNAPVEPVNPTYTPPPTTSTTSAKPTGTPTVKTTTSSSGRYTPAPPDMNPDQPPYPTTYREVHDSLENNPLYSQTMLPTQCSISQIDLVNAPASDIESYMNDFVECLMASWYGPVADAGYSLPRPSVTVYTSAMNSACGELPMYNAVYCAADQQIYYAKNLIEAFPSNMQTMRFLAESVIAHEFGHTVQFRTTIFASESVLEYDATSEDDQMDLSRRMEMQADCFAGVFLNSIATSADLSGVDEQNIVSMFTTLGGTEPHSDDHGVGTNRAFWASTGLASLSPGVCGTFTAASDTVS